MRRHVTPLNVVVTVLLTVSLVSSSWAAPVRRLVTGKQIKNNSLTSADVKNGALRASDFRAGELRAANGSPGSRGSAGATGSSGAPGAAGGPGALGATGAPGADSPTSGAAQLWAFRDSGDPSKAVMLASFGVPQPAALGAEGQGFRDDLVYSFHVDQDGDGAGDIRYDFSFKTTVAPGQFLRASGQVTSPTDPDLTVRQTYRLTRTAGATTDVLLDNQLVAPPNLGPRVMPQATYESSLSQPVVAAGAGGLQAWAGQRKDPAFADTSVNELLTLRPIQSNHLIPTPPNSSGIDASDVRNVMMIALRVPRTGSAGICPGTCATVNDRTSVVGLYATTGRPGAGGTVQTSRAGLPLVRELFTPLAERARFATTPPAADTASVAQILDPAITKLLPSVYPTIFSNANVPSGGAANRPDLVAYLTGQLSGLSAANKLGAYDLLRLNLASAPGAGFPNGRQLADDVVDTVVQVAAGVFTDPDHDGRINKLDGTNNPTGIPYSALSDGVSFDSEQPLLGTFPYAPTPISPFAQSATNP